MAYGTPGRLGKQLSDSLHKKGGRLQEHHPRRSRQEKPPLTAVQERLAQQLSNQGMQCLEALVP